MEQCGSDSLSKHSMWLAPQSSEANFRYCQKAAAAAAHGPYLGRPPLANPSQNDEATLQNFSQFPRNCFLFVCHRLNRDSTRLPVCPFGWLADWLDGWHPSFGIVRGTVTGDSVKWLQYVIRFGWSCLH